MAINIDLIADVKGVIKGTRQIGDALDDVADDLKDLGKDGDRLEDDLSGAFKGIGKEGDRLEDKASAVFKSVGDDARKAGKDIGREVKDGTDKAGDGLNEMKDEAAGTAREAAASFGSIEDGADALQEVLANAFVGFGPAGAAAGLAAAAGIGLAITAMQDAAATSTEAKQKAVDMVDAIAEAGGNLADIDLADRIKSWGREVIEDNWMTFWADESSTKFQEVAKDAEAFGVKAKDAIRAASGSADDSRQFLQETADDWQVLTERMEEGSRVSADGAISFDDGALAAKRQRDALSDLRGQAEENIRVTENAVQIYELENEAIGENTAALEAAKEATEQANEALRDRADALTESANAAMGADEAELNYVATLQQSQKDIEANGKTVDINTEAGRANRETLLEMAGASRQLIDAQIAQGGTTAEVTKTTQGARDAFVQAAQAAGFTKDQAHALADQYGLIPKNVDTHVKAHNIPETEAAINNVARARNVPVHLNPQGQAVENYIAGMNGRPVYVDIVPRNGTGRGIN